MKRKILNNLGLKLLSVVLAIVFWFLVVMADNPKDSVSFSNIQVNLINTELLERAINSMRCWRARTGFGSPWRRPGMSYRS